MCFIKNLIWKLCKETFFPLIHCLSLYASNSCSLFPSQQRSLLITFRRQITLRSLCLFSTHLCPASTFFNASGLLKSLSQHFTGTIRSFKEVFLSACISLLLAHISPLELTFLTFLLECFFYPPHLFLFATLSFTQIIEWINQTSICLPHLL